MSVTAFHVKAGRSQVDFFAGWNIVFLLLSGPVAMLRSALSRSDFSLGACWAFSVQPVLPSDYRPVVLLLESGTRARRLTQSPELGFGFRFCLPRDVFCFYAAISPGSDRSSQLRLKRIRRRLYRRSANLLHCRSLFYLCFEHVDNF